MEDLTLTLNPAMFMKGLDTIGNGIGKLNQNFSQMGKTGDQKIQKIGMSAMSLVKTLAPIAIAGGAIRKAFSQIPELGRAFSIAGDIFSRNLLWPLRKELMPMLQSMLSWVRDNRAMFLRWGNVLANIFRTVVSLVKSVFSLLKRLWDRITSGIERVFGKTVRSMSDLVNIALFKLAAIGQFIMAMLEPVFDFIADLFVSALENVKAFIGGFMDGLGELSPELNDMWESLKRIGESLGLLGDKVGSLRGLFSALGSTIGTLVGGVLRAVKVAIDGIATAIEGLQTRFAQFKAWRAGDMKEVVRLEREGVIKSQKFLKRTAETGKRQWESIKGTGAAYKELFVGDREEEKKQPQVLRNNVVKNTKNVNQIDNRKNTPLKNNITNVTNNQNRNNVTNVTKNQNRKNVTNITKGSIKRTNNVTHNKAETKVNAPITININESNAPKDIAKAVKSHLRDSLQEARFRSGGK